MSECFKFEMIWVFVFFMYLFFPDNWTGAKLLKNIAGRTANFMQFPTALCHYSLSEYMTSEQLRLNGFWYINTCINIIHSSISSAEI